MAYIDYDFYINDFHGTAVTLSDFDKLAEEASATIDYLTFDRAEPIITAGDETSLIEKIKMAICAIVDVLSDISINGSSIRSEGVASYRVTYAYGADKQASRDVRCTRVAKLYLGSSGLMYKGLEEL